MVARAASGTGNMPDATLFASYQDYQRYRTVGRIRRSRRIRQMCSAID
ncbi:hypothetical protein HMPREF9547_02445 [Escherichia coli MS 175-1]|nr:hypothetical protein HMPREF9551_05070 [Escherichia coli MS 196-1]EFJ66394.1 hypothetical protein HMPREF9547_02445 [Escherichia coli MS 175-1]EFK12851.1 hypothetical protein HMPREF9541_04792 [Escherichia coli MS 116-1]ESD98853.1 hypothetical protein HMPREF1616_04966 [Escherichia coli 908658]